METSLPQSRKRLDLGLRLLGSPLGGALSGLAGWAANTAWPRPFLRRFLAFYSRLYRVNLAEAEKPLEAYRTFREFFTRELKPGLRPMDPDPRRFVSPVDGTLAAAGPIDPDTLLQAKGLTYRLEDLLADAALARRFEGGAYLNLYLSPRDYHRFHAPANLEVLETIHVPGRLLPVNDWSRGQVPGLYAGNERVIARTRLESGAELLLVFVAATVVGKVHLLFDETMTTHNGARSIERTAYSREIRFRRGEALGWFELGSTVLAFAEPGAVHLEKLEQGSAVRLHETMGQLKD